MWILLTSTWFVVCCMVNTVINHLLATANEDDGYTCMLEYRLYDYINSNDKEKSIIFFCWQPLSVGHYSACEAGALLLKLHSKF